MTRKMDSSLRDLSSASGRLAEYLEYLGLSYKELEAHYGIGHSTWQVAATTGKKASSKILDALPMLDSGISFAALAFRPEVHRGENTMGAGQNLAQEQTRKRNR